jgi:transposase
VKREDTRFDLTWRIAHDRLAEEARCDGIFPLITNVVTLSERELLLAYKQQPRIETRFAQLKTDFVVAPVYLKETSRIQALLCVYFFVLLAWIPTEGEPANKIANTIPDTRLRDC